MTAAPFDPANETVEDYVTRSRCAQGLSDRIDDPVALRKLVDLVTASEPKQGEAA